MTPAFPLNQPMCYSEFVLGSGKAGTDPAEPFVPEWAESSRFEGVASVNHALAVKAFRIELYKDISKLDHCIALSMFGGYNDTTRDAWDDMRLNRRKIKMGRIIKS